MKDKINLKALLEDEKTMIVCDANVYLHIYAFAQGYCDFAVECLNVIKDFIIIPSMVEIEFKQHYNKCYNGMKNRVKNASEQCIKSLKSAKSSIMAACMNLKKMRFPDVDELLQNLDEKIEEQLTIVNDFFMERKDTLYLVEGEWKNKDFVLELVNEIREKDHILKPFTQLELYRLCEEGRKRYKKSTPPGYKDNDKDGIRKYGDFIWWSEICQYAKREKKDIILVTDDVKSDWWNKNEDGTIEFREELVKEFRETKQEIYPFTSSELYEKIAEDYDIGKPDIVQYALEITDEGYCERISEDVFSLIESNLIYDGAEYIDESTAHIGDLGIDEFEIESWDFVGWEQLERDEDEVKYKLKFTVLLFGVSHCYSGSDVGRKEIYYSPAAYHTFEGIIEVEVKRRADILLDFTNEKSFESAEIIFGDLHEISYKPFDESVEWNEYDVDVELEALGEKFNINMKKDAYTTCSMCGCPLSIINDAGGVCNRCSQKFDV